MNTPNDMPGVGYGSINCNGLGNAEKRTKFLNWLLGKQEEIICLQETHATCETEDEWRKIWGSNIYFSHGTSKSTGVAILIRSNSNVEINSYRELIPGRAQLLEITYNSVNLCLINVYAPNNDDIKFLKSVFNESLGRSRNDYTLFGGDWNAIMDDKLDKLGGAEKHSAQKSQAFLNTMCNDYGLCDILRLHRGKDRIFSHVNRTYRTSSRLDFFLIDDNLVNFPVCVPNISHGFMTDHSYISLFIKGTAIERGKGYWKFNNSFLDDEKFIENVKVIIQDTVEESYDSYRGLWDTVKFKIKNYAIKYGGNKKK